MLSNRQKKSPKFGKEIRSLDEELHPRAVLHDICFLSTFCVNHWHGSQDIWILSQAASWSGTTSKSFPFLFPQHSPSGPSSLEWSSDSEESTAATQLLCVKTGGPDLGFHLDSSASYAPWVLEWVSFTLMARVIHNGICCHK